MIDVTCISCHITLIILHNRQKFVQMLAEISDAIYVIQLSTIGPTVFRNYNFGIVEVCFNVSARNGND